MSTSCGPAGYQEGAIYYPYPDATFSWTSPGKFGANSGCDITVTSGFPLALSLQTGTCDGPEVQCENGSFNMGTWRGRVRPVLAYGEMRRAVADFKYDTLSHLRVLRSAEGGDGAYRSRAGAVDLP